MKFLKRWDNKSFKKLEKKELGFPHKKAIEGQSKLKMDKKNKSKHIWEFFSFVWTVFCLEISQKNKSIS